MSTKIKIIGPKFAHFGSFEGPFLTILGVKKVVLQTFSKLFCIYLRSVWALFSVIKGLFWLYFKLESLINVPNNQDIRSNLLIFRTNPQRALSFGVPQSPTKPVCGANWFVLFASYWYSRTNDSYLQARLVLNVTYTLQKLVTCTRTLVLLALESQYQY